MTILYREYQPSDAESWLKLHDSIFPPITRQYWDEWSAREDVTAVVAIQDGEVVGTIPFHLREFVIRPGATIRAAFEYSVGVREDLRGQGIGSKLMDCAKQVLRDRCDAMMVFRGEERSLAYNFYLRNGHHDTIFARSWMLEDTRDRPTGRVDLQPIEELYRREEEVLEVFESAYAQFGGYAQRKAGFWRPMLENCNWEEVKHDMRFFCLEREGRIMGYAVAGKQRNADVVTLMELATRDGDVPRARIILSAVAAFAGALGSSAQAHYPDNGLYADALRAVGFVPKPRGESSMFIMAHALNPESVVRAAWVETDVLKDSDVIAWSPKRQVVLHKSSNPRRTIQIELKDDLLTRLLFCRLDVIRAWENELLTVYGGGREEVEAIAAGLPFTKWEYHHMEMI